MRKYHFIWFSLFLGCLCVSSYAQSGKTTNSGKSYTCTTNEGRKLVADYPIRECADREQLIKGSSGATLAIVPPQLSQRQQNLLRAERDRQEAIFKREREQKQAEQQYQRNLRERYPTLAAYDNMRVQETTPILEKINEAKANLLKHQSTFDDLNYQVNGYADPDKIPKNLARDYEYAEHEVTTQKKFIENLEQQLKKLNDRYKADLQILEPYWKSRSTSTARP